MESYLFEPLNFSLTHRSHDKICSNIPSLGGNAGRLLGDENEPYASFPEFVGAINQILCSQQSRFVKHHNHSKPVRLRPTRTFLVDLLKFVSDVSLTTSEHDPEISIGL